jgi:Icc-related predicted phosphoesterase
LTTVRVLAVADEVSEALLGETLDQLRPELIVSCGDLPFDYLENLISRTDKPLVYVPGNHDPKVKPVDSPAAGITGPAGGDNVDGRILEAGGLTIAGLGGSIRYRPGGPNQYTQRQMLPRAFRLEALARLRRRRIDILLSHAPPAGYGDASDPAHVGFTALTRLVTRMRPTMLIHGHVQKFPSRTGNLRLGVTVIVNAIPYRLLEI